jgi:cystathionine beta-lyase family protein involved in aluminum resistance
MNKDKGEIMKERPEYLGFIEDFRDRKAKAKEKNSKGGYYLGDISRKCLTNLFIKRMLTKDDASKSQIVEEALYVLAKLELADRFTE